MTQDADCDGVLDGIDCDDTAATIGGDCSVCFEYFDLTSSSLVASNEVNVAPFIEGTNSRIPSAFSSMLPAPYTSLSSTDLFDSITGIFETFPTTDSVSSPSMTFANPQGLVSGTETVHGSFTEMVLDVNEPNDYYMNTTTLINTRHYRGGVYTIYSLDAIGSVTVLATYDILDFHLEIDYGQASMGNYIGAMEADVYLQLIDDQTGVVPVDPLLSSVFISSNDLIQHTDGVSNSGPWEIYTSAIHDFMPLNTAQVCP